MSKDFKSIRCFLLVALLTFPMTALADEWPQHRGPNRDGVWPEPLFTTAATSAANAVVDLNIEERWRRPIGSGYSGVVIADGRVFTMTSDETHNLVVALDASSGKELWRTLTDDVFPSGSGAVPGPLSTPAVANGMVFALAPEGRLLALSAADGTVRWKRDLAADFGATIPTYGMTTSPLVHGDQVLVQIAGEKAYLAAFETTTGELAWSENHGSGGIYSSPLLATLGGIEQLVVPSATALYAVDPNEGKLFWSHPLENVGVVDRMPLVLPNDRVFLPLMRAGGRMFNIRSKVDDSGERSWQVEELWQTPRLTMNTHAPPIYYDGHLYGMNGNLLTCISAEDGTVRWRSRIYDGTLILVAGHLVVMSAGSGKLHLVRATPDAFEEKLVTDLLQIGHHTVTPPSYADRTIYIRNVEELVALELRPGKGDPSQVAEQTPESEEAIGLREVWRRPLATGIHPAGDAGLTVNDGHLYTLVADDAHEFAVGMDAADGTEIWRKTLDPVVENSNGPGSTPAVADGKLFALSSACRLRALNTENGDLVWQVDLPAELGDDGPQNACKTSPRLIDGTLILLTGAPEKQRIMALNPANGKQLWTADGLAMTTNSSPVGAVLGGTPQALINGRVMTENGPRSLLYSVRPKDGKALWSFQAEKFFSWLDPVPVDEKVLLPTWRQTYFLSPPANSSADDNVPQASQSWLYPKTLDGAVYREGILYAYQDDDLIAMQAADGKELWRHKTFFGQLALANDQLLVLGYKTGLLRLVEATPDGYKETARRSVLNPGAANNTPPAFADGVFFVRNQEELVALTRSGE